MVRILGGAPQQGAQLARRSPARTTAPSVRSRGRTNCPSRTESQAISVALVARFGASATVTAIGGVAFPATFEADRVIAIFDSNHDGTINKIGGRRRQTFPGVGATPFAAGTRIGSSPGGGGCADGADCSRARGRASRRASVCSWRRGRPRGTPQPGHMGQRPPATRGSRGYRGFGRPRRRHGDCNLYEAMNRINVPILLTLVAALGGCDLLHAATADKLDSTQTTALKDLIGQTGSLAAVIADPDETSGSELADALALDHFVHLVRPDVAATRAAPRLARAAPPPECIVDAAGILTATECEVPIGERTCRVSGTMRSTPGETRTRYAGELAVTGEGCPRRAIRFDFELAGLTSKPTELDGQVDFSEDRPPGDVYSGRLVFRSIGLAGSCDRPSKGKLDVRVDGVYGGEAIADDITVSFNESPECGVLLIED